MQTGGRRRSTADDLGIDRLITLLILEFFLNIGRQRHAAELLQHLKEDTFIMEFNQTVAVRQDFLNLRRQLTIAESDLRALAQTASRTDQALPDIVAAVDQQKDLRNAAARAVSDQARGQDAGIVEHETVAGIQELRQLIKMMMPDFSGLFVQYQQTGGVPLIQRSLGNQTLGQIIIKITCLHTVVHSAAALFLLTTFSKLSCFL